MDDGGGVYVPGSGPVPCKGMVIGEAPGRREQEAGRPFVGTSGTLLEEGLSLGGLTRADVYITNVIKVGLPGNRNPHVDEVERWLPELVGEGRRVDPVYTLILGRVAFGALFPRTLASHGTMENIRGRTWERGNRVWMPTYHPAATLYDRTLKDAFLIDVASFAAAVKSAAVNDSIVLPDTPKVVIPLIPKGG